MEAERQHLEQCKTLIRHNISSYEQQTEKLRGRTRELYAAVTSGNNELYDQLIVVQDLQEHSENQLRKNRAALNKPYFGRIDYQDFQENQAETLYIGKNGISKDRTEVVIVDWRAPVSALYYENEPGVGSYHVPEIGAVQVDLQKKRTFDINQGELIGYFDNDIAATDELLVKYLAQNKEAVLGDIISTIQKEQNQIIRQPPYRNLIVQGVAGSGKTTVAMHRISYILYNYKERFTPDVFCIIGSNDTLLDYITSGLPELDVRGVKQKRMDQFLVDLLEKDWKKQYRLEQAGPEQAGKSSLEFVRRLDRWLDQLRQQVLWDREVKDGQIGLILSENHIRSTLADNPALSLAEICKILNGKVRARIRFLVDAAEENLYRQKIKEYSGWFKLPAERADVVRIYQDFLGQDLGRRFNVYDAAALVLIRRRITAKKPFDEVEQVFIDEAQDFGIMIYYVLKQVLKNCWFTVMGDVSQNINYTTGMNEWDELLSQVFSPEQTQFHILAKSYRNTIEISEFAGRILERASFGRYRIEPVIRHGADVAFHRFAKAQMVEETAGLVRKMQESGYGTIALVCANEESAEQLKRQMAGRLVLGDGTAFGQGVMVLPVRLTKGLEFDGVILWNPDEQSYPAGEAYAKLLYVAVTRALHELHLVYDSGLSVHLQ